MEHTVKKRKITCLNICDFLPTDIIKLIFTFLDNTNHHIKTLPYVCKYFLNCVNDYNSWCNVITFNNKFNKPQILMKKKFKQINCKGDDFNPTSSFILNTIIDNSSFVEDLRFTDSNINTEHIGKLSKFHNLKNLSLDNCCYLVYNYRNLFPKFNSLENVIIISCGAIESPGLFELVTLPLKKLYISDSDIRLSYLNHVNVSKLEIMHIGRCNWQSDKRYFDNFFDRLYLCSSLHSLTISFSKINKEVDESLLKLSHLNLKFLCIKGAYNLIGYFVEKVNFKRLESLILQDTTALSKYLILLLNKTISLNTLKIAYYDTFDSDKKCDINSVLENVLHIPTLKMLYLQNTTIDNEGLKYLKKFNLQKLYIIDNNRITDDGLSHIKNIKLFKLDLSYCINITDNGLVHLKNIRLINLNLTYCTKIQDKGLIHLRNMPLNILSLGSTNITGEGLIHLKNLPLTSLNVSDTRITDRHLEYIKHLQLRELYMRYNCITINSLYICSAMPLKKLSLTGCSLIKSNDITCLKSILVR
jgi:hypothetical protein